MNPGPPMALLAELTHRCPLACPYCSNPVDLVRRSAELPTEAWVSVLREAAEIGVLHVHFSGGEPASRRDLEALVAVAAEAGLYTNLITSGVGLTEVRIQALAERGLDHLQLSVQAPEPALADRISGYRDALAQKRAVAAWTNRAGMALTVNAVMHRANLGLLPQTIDMAVELGAQRLEVAHVQYHGWALRNRGALLPTRAQADAARAIVDEARSRLSGILQTDYVPPDHFAQFPKPCMGGWGQVGMTITPEGKVLPCHAAETIPHLTFEAVGSRPLGEIWADSAAFNAYRGTDWMSETCRACPRREIDFGGCRCQALAHAGDAAATDPACERSPMNAEFRQRVAAEPQSAFVYRRFSTG
ncbi:MAG: pyrroloquinoline quinone biosynthesis protein PqqE [Paracoccaceae bacterium]|nr:pyrroloquinoline quinone biosynthesis protein PqqE [Paracoccaceae bacterium]